MMHSLWEIYGSVGLLWIFAAIVVGFCLGLWYLCCRSIACKTESPAVGKVAAKAIDSDSMACSTAAVPSSPPATNQFVCFTPEQFAQLLGKLEEFSGARDQGHSGETANSHGDQQQARHRHGHSWYDLCE